VGGGREGGHVDADLGDELLGAYRSDAGHRIQLGDLRHERSDCSSICAVSSSIRLVSSSIRSPVIRQRNP
jgi:hypothetical protein